MAPSYQNTTLQNKYEFEAYNAFVTGIFCVVDFCGKVAKPPQK
jgi:hypothetical protein